MQREVASLQLLAAGIEVEVEGIDGVDLGEVSVAQAPLDGALDAALLLFIGEPVRNLERGEVLLRRLSKELGRDTRHAGQLEPLQFLEQQLKLVLVALLHVSFSAGGSPGFSVFLERGSS